MTVLEKMLTRFDIPVGDGDGAPDLFDLLGTLALAEQRIGNAVDAHEPPIDDATLERVTIRPRLADGRPIAALRIGCEEDGLTFTVTLIPGDAL